LSWLGRIKNYFSQSFKPMIVLAFILFYIGLIVRFTDADSQVDFTAARFVYLDFFKLNKILLIIFHLSSKRE